MALRRRRRALSPWPLLAALHAIVLEGMLDRQADPIGPRADPIRLHRRTLRRRVLRRTRRARDVLNLILRHVGREIRHVPEDAEDLLVPQADVVEKRDDRETAHVRDVLVVLDCARRLYMHGGNRVMLTFPMSSALKVAFFASRMPRISRRSARKAETMSSFTGSGRPSSMCR